MGLSWWRSRFLSPHALSSLWTRAGSSLTSSCSLNNLTSDRLWGMLIRMFNSPTSEKWRAEQSLLRPLLVYIARDSRPFQFPQWEKCERPLQSERIRRDFGPRLWLFDAFLLLPVNFRDKVPIIPTSWWRAIQKGWRYVLGKLAEKPSSGLPYSSYRTNRGLSDVFYVIVQLRFSYS